MQNKIFLAILSSSLLSLGNGAAVDVRSALDVFVPHIISPNATTTWVVGRVEAVTWDTSDAPENISNGSGVVLNSPLTGPLVNLTNGFDLRSGSVNVIVPDVAAGIYTITLFGDSGNRSPPFEIVTA